MNARPRAKFRQDKNANGDEALMAEGVPGTIPYFVASQVRELIMNGTFRPGQPLREQDLEQRFSISRGPVREALRLLEVRGLVSHVPRRGFRVKLYEDRELRDHFMLRGELEALAILQLTGIDDLSPLVDELTTARAELTRARDANDPRAYLQSIRSFYDLIANFSGNTPLREVLDRLNDAIEPVRYNLLLRKLGESQTLDYTGIILDALAERRFQDAAEAKRAHVMSNLDNILTAYREARYEP